MELKYKTSKKIFLKKHFNEKWLQNRIEDDPSIIGLGDLDVIHRERKQSSGGRIDFLFLNSDLQTMYETEIQLGTLDESHIIRTIEYWDIERRRFPSKDHRAVIIAEEITNRFFNVISLLNRSVPIIAIQLNALKVDENIILNFTKVLDVYELPEDEEQLAGEEVSRLYWEKKSNKKAIELMDKIIDISKLKYPETRITYNKHHVAIGTERRNFMWFHPRKSPFCRIEIKLDREEVEEISNKLEEIGLPYTVRKEDEISLSINSTEFNKNKSFIELVVHKAIEIYK